MKTKTKKVSIENTIELDSYLPNDIYVAFVNGKSVEGNETLLKEFVIGSEPMNETKGRFFSKNSNAKEFITFVTNELISDVPSKDAIIDDLQAYSCVFYLLYDDIITVLNNIHNKAFELAVSNYKSTFENLDTYFEFVEKHLSTLTPKLIKMKESVKKHVNYSYDT